MIYLLAEPINVASSYKQEAGKMKMEPTCNNLTSDISKTDETAFSINQRSKAIN